MSKWMNLLLMGLGALACFWMAVYLSNSDKDYALRGESATVLPGAEIRQEVRSTTGRAGQTTGERTVLMATMRYQDKAGQQRQFQRAVSPQQVAQLQGGQPLELQYIPGEWNSERFPGQDMSPRWPAGMGAIFALGFVSVWRKPSAQFVQPERSVSVLQAIVFRSALLLMGLGGLMAGGAGLLGGDTRLMNWILLAVGVAALLVNRLAARLR